MPSERETARNGARGERGAFLVMAAGGIVFLLLLAGVAIDGARIFRAREAVAHAVQLGVARSVLDHTNREVELRESEYRGVETISRNIREAGFEPATDQVSITFNSAGNQATGTGGARLNLFLMKYIVPQLQSVKAESQYARDQAEMFISVDWSGSMCGNEPGDSKTNPSAPKSEWIWNRCQRVQGVVDASKTLLKPLSTTTDKFGIGKWGAWPTRLAPIQGHFDKAQMTGIIDSMMPYVAGMYSSTNTWAGLKDGGLAFTEAIDDASNPMSGTVNNTQNPQVRKILVFISDGRANMSTQDLMAGGNLGTQALDSFGVFPAATHKGQCGNIYDRRSIEFANCTKAAYNLAIAWADHLRESYRSFQIVSVGVGSSIATAADPNDPFLDITDTTSLNHYALARIAADMTTGKDHPQIPASPILPDEVVFGTVSPQTISFQHIPTYEELRERGVRPGLYLEARDPRTLKTKIKAALAFIQGRFLPPHGSSPVNNPGDGNFSSYS